MTNEESDLDSSLHSSAQAEKGRVRWSGSTSGEIDSLSVTSAAASYEMLAFNLPVLLLSNPLFPTFESFLDWCRVHMWNCFALRNLLSCFAPLLSPFLLYSELIPNNGDDFTILNLSSGPKEPPAIRGH